MQSVLFFSTKPVGKETFLEVSSPLMNDKAVCKTAVATPDMLNIMNVVVIIFLFLQDNLNLRLQNNMFFIVL